MLSNAQLFLIDSSLTIRRARPQDTRSLEVLAAVDSAKPLAGDVLVAETEAGPVAALEVESGRAVADPFKPTASTVGLLKMRASQLAR